MPYCFWLCANNCVWCFRGHFATLHGCSPPERIYFCFWKAGGLGTSPFHFLNPGFSPSEVLLMPRSPSSQDVVLQGCLWGTSPWLALLPDALNLKILFNETAKSSIQLFSLFSAAFTFSISKLSMENYPQVINSPLLVSFPETHLYHIPPPWISPGDTAG